ncbi:MAG: MBL fold metallo-hydrolase [Planctomycetota bacterium]
MSGVRVIVLGTVQDGGVPHPCCACPRCEAARRDPTHRRLPACIALVGESGRILVVDATPAYGEQLALLGRLLGDPAVCPDELVITHAHIGHYLGLAFLGKEAIHARGLPVLGTPSFLRFVQQNRPWSHLVERGEIELRTIAPGSPHAFDGVVVHAFLSPHRGEDTDTLGFEIVGPRRRLVYVSDADVLPAEIVERVHDADVSLVDGTFFSPAELPHRDILAVKHPFVRDSVDRLRGGRGRVFFTHLNHTNPLLDPTSPEARSLPPGFAVAAEGQTFEL